MSRGEHGFRGTCVDFGIVSTTVLLAILLHLPGTHFSSIPAAPTHRLHRLSTISLPISTVSNFSTIPTIPTSYLPHSHHVQPTCFPPLPPHALPFQTLFQTPVHLSPHNFPRYLPVLPNFSAFPVSVSVFTLVLDLTTSTTTLSLSPVLFPSRPL
ncbi:hypothetical protein K435DRAFT_870524 [Dendrothele bispora CBS 962.96]|uniref:Uncharacterized protein n=1 Tax=Dendrothele bispora (strain CBS 962.96) TaxID=1314807 RepID=A0A4S8L728_DENBC|nr:hypothetical protein K435DRAFT_870524 [Dendrothele bispora CBS 962.96]